MRASLQGAFAQALGTASAVTCLVSPAIGDDLIGERKVGLPGVVVTGTHIPAIEAATALPVQTITRAEIERANIQTAAQLVNTLSAATSFSSFNEARGLGNAQGGFAGAALRGLGFQFTVVLINGRRIANYANTTRGSDLNAIPLAAVERVEVLRDGASAIYGADAIGGVINFILRKEYTGVEASTQYTSPEHTGGYAKRLTAWVGFGDFAQGFNAYANVDYQTFGGIQAADRPFASRNYIPEEGIDRTGSESLPANVLTPAGLRSPTGDPGNGYANPSCAPPLSAPTASNPAQCRWFGDGTTTLVDPSERVHAVGSLAWRFAPDHEMFLGAIWTRNRFRFATAPTAVSEQTTGGIPFLLPPSSGFYPHDFASAFGLDGMPLDVYWRAQDLGAQSVEPISEQWNGVAGVRGDAAGWRYESAFDYSRSTVDVRYARGFVRQSLLMPILDTGVVNPFALNAPDVVDRLSGAKIDGVLSTSTSTLASFDLRASRDLLALPTGPLLLAVGVEAFREELSRSADPALATGDVLGAQGVGPVSGARNVRAAFAEASIPLLASLEANVAVRYDHYSDFGGTTNPKVSLRWQPAPALLARASAGRGFLAPSLSGLFTPAARGMAQAPLDDPARCPFTFSPQDCGRHFPTLAGGNPALQPVKSRQWSAGAIWAPTREFSLGVDYVSILLHDRINFYLPVDLLRGCPDGVTGLTCQLVHRGVDAQNPEVPGPIVQIDQFITNLGKKKVSAVDVDARYVTSLQRWGRLAVGFNGTFNIRHLEQQADGSYVDLVDTYSTSGGVPGIVPRWRHYLALDWSLGPWSATLTENYQTGAYEPAPNASTRRIGDYDVWNLSFAFTGFASWTLSAGIKNLFDRDPPFSNQNANVQVGYDPSYGDPHGRLYWIGASYTLR